MGVANFIAQLCNLLRVIFSHLSANGIACRNIDSDNGIFIVINDIALTQAAR